MLHYHMHRKSIRWYSWGDIKNLFRHVSLAVTAFLNVDLSHRWSIAVTVIDMLAAYLSANINLNKNKLFITNSRFAADRISIGLSEYECKLKDSNEQSVTLVSFRDVI